ncbi:MAG: hypothetical protein AABY22_06060, partial [Nanoarchaeota archaeon]
MQQKNQAQISIKNVLSESLSLNPSALITLFEIDISDIGFQIGIISETEIQLEKNTIFRFHNNVNLTTKSIFWQNKEYTAAPIEAKDFEMNMRGNVPTPKISMTVSDEGIALMTIFKQRILEFSPKRYINGLSEAIRQLEDFYTDFSNQDFWYFNDRTSIHFNVGIKEGVEWNPLKGLLLMGDYDRK